MIDRTDRLTDKIDALTADRRRGLLDQRTQALARPAQSTAEKGEAILLCQAGGGSYGLSIGEIAEVIPFRPCVPVAGANPAMLGLFGRSGRMVSALDLAGALTTRPADTSSLDGHLLLVRGFNPPVALRVDRVIGTIEVRRVASGDLADGGGDRDAIIAYGQSLTDPAMPLAALIDLARLLRPFLPSPSLIGA